MAPSLKPARAFRLGAAGIQVPKNLCAEELHVDVLTQPHVVGEIPTQVIGILIENDVVGIP
jgi:hypothetical protein